MSSTFQFKGRFDIKPSPTSTDLSGDFEIAADVLERLEVTKRLATVVALGADGVETLNMADIANAAVVIVKADNEVIVRVTTSAGATQAIGGVTFLMLLCTDDPVTAITLERAAGIATVCRVTLAEV